LLIFIGIIDILQSYGMAKKLEHTWKSIIHDGDTVSVHRPAFYASRFKKFLSDRVFKKMPPNLKPAMSFRRPAATAKRLISKDSNSGDSSEKEKTRVDRVDRLSTDNSVTVITIGADVQESSSILPSVLRDKPRTSTNTGPTPGPAHVTQQRTRVVSGRPDVADVVGVACTPPPDLGGHGGITTDDERIQIYVPSPQSTPYSTISRHVVDNHKNITFVNYKADTPEDDHVPTPESSVNTVSSVSVIHEDATLLHHHRKPFDDAVQSEEQPVSLSHVEINLESEDNK